MSGDPGLLGAVVAGPATLAGTAAGAATINGVAAVVSIVDESSSMDGALALLADT